jgi:hypothetical protein
LYAAVLLIPLFLVKDQIMNSSLMKWIFEEVLISLGTNMKVFFVCRCCWQSWHKEWWTSTTRTLRAGLCFVMVLTRSPIGSWSFWGA